MHWTIRSYILLLLYFILASVAISKPMPISSSAILLKDWTQNYSINSGLKMFEDKTTRMSLEEILKNQSEFKTYKGDVLRLQPTSSAIWCIFKMKNLTEKKWFLQVGSHHLDKINLYILRNNTLTKEMETGLHIPFQERIVKVNEYIFPLDLSQNTEQSYLLRIQCNTTINIPLTAATLQKFYEINHRQDVMNGLYFGLIIALSLYNFFVFISIKDITYLFYVLYICSLGITIAFLRGYAIELLPPTSPYTNQGNYSAALAFLFVVLFTNSFLFVSKNAPKLQWLNYIYFFLSFICIIITALGNSFLGFKLLMLEVVFIVPYVLIMGVYTWKANIKVARFYLLGFGSFTICDFIFILKENGILPVNIFTEYSLLIGSSTEAIVLSFALAYKLNIFKKEKDASLALALLKANEFSKQLIKLQEDERKRIAAELHDSVGQSLSVIKNRTFLLQKDSSKLSSIDEIGEIVTQTIEEVRNISYGLRPYQLDLLGLTQAIITLIEEVGESSSIQFNSQIGPISDLVSKEAEINIYRIIQETLNNIVKHSEATVAGITIIKEADYLEMQIKDNGKGIKENSKGNGFGLIGIQKRVNILRGKINVSNQLLGGTLISIIIPLEVKLDLHQV